MLRGMIYDIILMTQSSKQLKFSPQSARMEGHFWVLSTAEGHYVIGSFKRGGRHSFLECSAQVNASESRSEACPR